MNIIEKIKAKIMNLGKKKKHTNHNEEMTSEFDQMGSYTGKNFTNDYPPEQDSDDI